MITKVVHAWKANCIRMLAQGTPVPEAVARSGASQLIFIQEKRRDPDFAQNVQEALDSRPRTNSLRY